MIEPLVSIVIPTHNRFNTLKRAINSCLAQDYSNLEIIVVDDNFSNTELREKVTNYIENIDANISILTCNQQLGGAEARNVGIREAKGKYISFLDDDDEYMSNRIKKLMCCFRQSNDENFALVYSYGVIIYPNGKFEKERTNFRGNPLFVQMTYNIAGTSFWICKKKVLEEIGGFDKIHSHQDGLVLLKLLANNYSIDLVEEELVNYYAHGKADGITGVTLESIQADETYYEYCTNFFNLLTESERILVKKDYHKKRIKRLILLEMDEEVKKEINQLKKNSFLSVFDNIQYECLFHFRVLIRYIENKKQKKNYNLKDT